jgi:hypothetical protein
MACYFIQISCIQSGTSNKTQATENKPMERDMKKKLQRPSRNYHPPGPVLPPRCLPRCFPEVKTVAVKKLRPEFPPQPPEVPPTGTTAKVPPKFWKRAKSPLDITASKAVICGSTSVVGRYYRLDRYYRPFWPVLPPDRNYRPQGPELPLIRVSFRTSSM